ncbi:hypothetical protein ACFYYK_41655, partial [Kitasatospora indigofera]
SDPDTGQIVRMRESEWLLLRLDRELARREARRAGADAAEADPPGPHAVPGATASAPRRRASGARIWFPVVCFAVGLLLGVAAALTATGTLRVPGFAFLEPASAPSAPTPTPLPIPSDYRTLLGVFDRGGRLESSIPSVLESSFPPDGIAIIFFPASGNTGTRVYAARPNASELCLVAVIPTEKLAMNCGELADVARSGLTLRFWLADGLQQSPSLLGDNVDITASMADVSWNRDGTFSITQTPID